MGQFEADKFEAKKVDKLYITVYENEVTIDAEQNIFLNGNKIESLEETQKVLWMVIRSMIGLVSGK